MSENIYIQPGTQYYPGLFDTEVILTIAKADQRYIKKGSDANYNVINATARIEVESTNNTSITSSSNCDDYGLHLHAVLASATGIRSGCAISFNNSSSDNIPLAAIALDKIGSGSGELVMSVRNGATCNERLRIKDDGISVSGSITVSKSSSGAHFIGVNGTSDCRIFQFNNGAGVFGTNSNHNIQFQTGATIRATIDTTGNMGIGTTSPTARLHVNGGSAIVSGNITCTTLIPQLISITNSGTTDVLTCNNSPMVFKMTSFTNAMVYGTTSNHGISFSTNNLIRFQIAPTGHADFIGDLEIQGTSLQTVSGQRGLLQASTQTFRSDTINNVPIGLKVAGWIWSDIGIISSSDKRLKRDIKEVSLDQAMKLLKINPITYISKNDASETPQVGFIAQDLIKNELDELTAIQPNQSVQELLEDDVLSPKGYSWSVSYDRVVVYLLKIIQKHESDIAALIELLPKTKRAVWDQQNQQADELK